MEILLDTADLSLIRRCSEILPVSGITTNPTIVSKSVRDGSPYDLLRNINSFAKEKGLSLHIQAVSCKAEGIIAEAERLKALFGEIYIKIPVTGEGLKAIRALSGEGYRITATAIYTYPQALYAALSGAEWLALYCNRMESLLGVDFRTVIEEVSSTLPEARILGASFRCFSQIKDAYCAGAEACTASPELLLEQLDQGYVLDAVKMFSEDWEKCQ